MQVDLRFEDQEDEQTMELSNVNNNASQEHKELFQNVEPGWTMQAELAIAIYLL